MCFAFIESSISRYGELSLPTKQKHYLFVSRFRVYNGHADAKFLGEWWRFLGLSWDACHNHGVLIVRDLRYVHNDLFIFITGVYQY